LCNQWHAYPFIIAPAAAAMVTAFYHLPVMNSYIQMPDAHAAAHLDPELAGGPFINLEGGQVEAVGALAAKTEAELANVVALAHAIRELGANLRKKTDGMPLEPHYGAIPAALRGYVELCYDLEHRAGFRLLESLLYQGAYYRPDLQSFCLTRISSDERPFIFSTPRLPTADNIMLPLRFDDPAVDFLASLKHTGQTWESIAAALRLDAAGDREKWMQVLTPTPPQRPAPYTEEGVRVRYFGHACVLLQTKDTAILVDPLISYRYESELDRFSFEDLPERIDYVLITHAHHDHIVLETLLQLRGRIGKIIVPRNGSGSLMDPSLRLILKHTGFGNVVEADDLDAFPVKGGVITAVPFLGEHCDLNIRTKQAYHVVLQDQSYLLAADANIFDIKIYEHVRNRIGPADHLFIGLECTGSPMSWSYGIFFTDPPDYRIDQNRRAKGSDAPAALNIAEAFGARKVFLYAMGLEPWLNYFMALQHSHSEASQDAIEELTAACGARGIAVETLYGKKEMQHAPVLR
jgi:L-ascorbate metabolism protein UlaG (beta-lactamase superfamily)